MMIPKIILISFKKNLFDTVDERKVHKGVVPRLGGVAFTPAIIISLAVAAGIYSLPAAAAVVSDAIVAPTNTP